MTELSETNRRSGAGLPGFVANAAIKQREQGRAPAVQPTRLVQQPIFWNARRATRYSVSSRSYTMRDEGVDVSYIAETANPVPIPDLSERIRDSPHGLLRYSDLDVLMALSYHFTRFGKPLVEVDQRTVLSWMGYQQFDEAPYRELRASIQRMASTTISVSTKGAKLPEYTPSRLVAMHGLTEGGGHGAKGTIRVSLAEEWRQSIGNGFTLVDMHAYAHLCRVDRECGLARVLYLFFSSLKDHQTGEFNLPIQWMAERWRDTSGTEQVPVYADPLDRRSNLHEALCLLHTSGVMSVGETHIDDRGRLTSERRITGTFAPAANIPRIPEDISPHQISLFIPHRITGLPAPAPEESPVRTAIIPVETSGERPSTMGPADVLRSERQLFQDACIAALVQDLGLSQRAIKKALHSEDWSNKAAMARMLLSVSWRYHEQRVIEKPAAYVMRILDKGSADDPQWTTAEADAQRWAMAPGGPLHRLQPMRDRIRELEQAVRRLPPVEQQPTSSTILAPAADPDHAPSAEDMARRMLADLGVRPTDERIRLLASIGKEARMAKTAASLRDDWSAEDAEAGDEDIDEDVVADVARELAEYKDAARRLGYAVAPMQARFLAAMEIVRVPERLQQWRTAISA